MQLNEAKSESIPAVNISRYEAKWTSGCFKTFLCFPNTCGLFLFIFSNHENKPQHSNIFATQPQYTHFLSPCLFTQTPPASHLRWYHEEDVQKYFILWLKKEFRGNYDNSFSMFKEVLQWLLIYAFRNLYKRIYKNYNSRKKKATASEKLYTSFTITLDMSVVNWMQQSDSL